MTLKKKTPEGSILKILTDVFKTSVSKNIIQISFVQQITWKRLRLDDTSDTYLLSQYGYMSSNFRQSFKVLLNFVSVFSKGSLFDVNAAKLDRNTLNEAKKTTLCYSRCTRENRCGRDHGHKVCNPSLVTDEILYSYII